MGARGELAGCVHSGADRRPVRRDGEQSDRRGRSAEKGKAVLPSVHLSSVGCDRVRGGNDPVYGVYHRGGAVPGVDVLCVRRAGGVDRVDRVHEPVVGHLAAGGVDHGAHLDGGRVPVFVVPAGRESVTDLYRMRGGAGAHHFVGAVPYVP